MSYKTKNMYLILALAMVGAIISHNVLAQGTLSLDFEDEVAPKIAEPKKANSVITPQKALPMEESVESLGLETDIIPAKPEPKRALPMPISADREKTPAKEENVALKNVSVSNDNLLENIDDPLFSQMSDLEKQTTLLTLELRREKVKNEIEAIKNQRRKAEDEEKEKAEEKIRKQEEFTKEQERKLLVEQQKLKELDLSMERLRQEKLLASYKEKMLSEQQKWINKYAGMHEAIEKEKDSKRSVLWDLKSKLVFLNELANKTTQMVENAKKDKDAEIKDLKTQISVLQARLEEETKVNPFALKEQEEAKKVAQKKEKRAVTKKLSELYVIMEIKGVKSNLLAKIVNNSGKSFLVKKGTVLQTGHVIDEITDTFVRADLGGEKDFIYFAGSGVLDKEPDAKAKIEIPEDEEMEEAAVTPKRVAVSASGVPGISRDMIVK